MTINPVVKQYLLSAALTFGVGFSITLLMDIDKITLATIADGTYVGFLFAAARAGVKALLEWIIAKNAAKKIEDNTSK